LDDCRDVANRRFSFIEQTNSVLCDFGEHDYIRHRLFRSYCSSYYGCELWLLDNSCVQEFCVAWRKGLRRIWNLPYNSRGDILCDLSGDIPVFDEICRKSMPFAAGSCLLAAWFPDMTYKLNMFSGTLNPTQSINQSSLLRFLVHRILFAPDASIFGRNINICAARYNKKASIR